MLSLVEVDDEDDDEEEEEEEDDDDWARRLITFGVCARLEGITRPIYGNPTCVCMSFIRWMMVVNVQYLRGSLHSSCARKSTIFLLAENHHQARPRAENNTASESIKRTAITHL